MLQSKGGPRRSVAATQRQTHRDLQQHLEGIRTGIAPKSKSSAERSGRKLSSKERLRAKSHTGVMHGHAGGSTSSPKSVSCASTSGAAFTNEASKAQRLPVRKAFLARRIRSADGTVAALSDQLSGFTAMVRVRAASNAVSPTQLARSPFLSRDGYST